MLPSIKIQPPPAKHIHPLPQKPSVVINHAVFDCMETILSCSSSTACILNSYGHNLPMPGLVTSGVSDFHSATWLSCSSRLGLGLGEVLDGALQTKTFFVLCRQTVKIDFIGTKVV